MKTSVSLWSYQKYLFAGKMTVVEAIEKIKEAGADAVELLDCFGMNFPQVRNKLKQLGLKVSSFSVSNNFFCEKEQLDDEIALVKFGIDAANYFGAKSVRVFIGYDNPNHTMEELMAQAIGAFKSLAPYAEANGIAMSLENHGLAAGKSYQVQAILDAVNSPCMLSNADTGNFFLVDENPVDAIGNLKGRIGLVHLKDVVEVAEHMQFDSIAGKHFKGTVIGKGQVDLPAIAKILKDSNYDGYLSVEYEGLEEDILGSVDESVKYSKAL
ncbi:MAG: sugar phosphate isomerase/epimerase [Clostridia bacterium]|nr:sugar phosphate isomerase/epimerase [Clostridia bacterium]